MSTTNIKKIGLATWIGWGNFGTSLQSYALHKKLTNLGYDVFLFESKPKQINITTSIKLIIKWFYTICGLDCLKHYRIRNFRAFKKFNQKKYNTKLVLTKQQFEQVIDSTDVFMTGSDQIWNAWHSYNPFYFFNFVQNKKKIAYASSMGTAVFPDAYVPEIKQLLTQFAHIGVREKSAADYLNTLLERNDIIQVLDPTFLLTPKEWCELANSSNKEIGCKPYIFCYLIGNNKTYVNNLKDICDKSGISNVIIIPAVENQDFYIKGAIVADNVGPEDFIWYLMNATLVCTDSFHATALSINFSKNFVEFLRFSDDDLKSQNSRIYDLLQHYCLSHKLYSPTDTEWLTPIDYISVQNKLASDRCASLEYLINAIQD